MPVLLIAYDLADEAANARAVTDTIVRSGIRWARPLASVWYVETDRRAEDIEAEISDLLGIDDGLLVQATIGEAAATNAMLRWTLSPGAEETEEGNAGAQILRWPVRSSKIAEAA